MKRAPGVKMTELKSSFSVFISEVGGARIIQADEQIAADSSPCAVLFCFLQAVCTNNPSISDGGSDWHIIMGSEVNVVGTWHIMDSLC